MSKPATPAATPAKTGKKSFGPRVMIICMLCAIGAVAVMPSTILVTLGMIPTAVAYFVDSSRERALGRVVFCLNFAGVLPSLLKLWQQGHTVANALDIAMQPMMMALFLIPAAFGWLLYAYVPHIVVGIVRRKAEIRIRTLEKYQEDLVEHWGATVGGVTYKSEAAAETKTEAIAAPVSA